MIISSRPALVRADRFRFREPPLLFARARLYEDRLELTGWHFRGRYRRAIGMHELLHADAPGGDRLLLWLADGEALRLRVAHAPDWAAAIAIQQRRGRQGDSTLIHSPLA